MKRSPLLPASLSSRRWLSYAAAGAATAVTGASSAEAEIHYSGEVNITFHVNNVFLKSHTAPLSGGAFLRFYQVRSFSGVTNLFEVEGATASGARATQFLYASRLRAGQVISRGPFEDDAGFVLVNHYGSGRFAGSGTGFIGFKFDLGKGPQYGWARIQEHKEGGYVVVDYAWGDPGDKVKAGATSLRSAADAVPATGSLGLLALGGSGLLAWRKSRIRAD
jgi:hypothetical protein